jgi:hypothetical protein
MSDTRPAGETANKPRIFISSALGPEGSEIRQARDDIHVWVRSEGYDAFLFEREKSAARTSSRSAIAISVVYFVRSARAINA